MIKLSKKQQKITEIIIKKGTLQSSDIYAEMIKMGEEISLVTVKRALSEMAQENVLATTGSGRSTSYDISSAGRVFAEVEAHKYCSIEPDKRYGLNRYNFGLLSALPPDIFTEDELKGTCIPV